MFSDRFSIQSVADKIAFPFFRQNSGFLQLLEMMRSQLIRYSHHWHNFAHAFRSALQNTKDLQPVRVGNGAQKHVCLGNILDLL